MRLYCQIPEFSEAWVDRPDVWLGIHAERYAETIERINEESPDMFPEYRTFAVSLALLDNWNLPDWNGNPAAWDLRTMPLQLIQWVNVEAVGSFNEARKVPKGSPSPLQNGTAGDKTEHGK